MPMQMMNTAPGRMKVNATSAPRKKGLLELTPSAQLEKKPMKLKLKKGALHKQCGSK